MVDFIKETELNQIRTSRRSWTWRRACGRSRAARSPSDCRNGGDKLHDICDEEHHLAPLGPSYCRVSVPCEASSFTGHLFGDALPSSPNLLGHVLTPTPLSIVTLPRGRLFPHPFLRKGPHLFPVAISRPIPHST